MAAGDLDYDVPQEVNWRALVARQEIPLLMR
jgi:hypothetical protein